MRLDIKDFFGSIKATHIHSVISKYIRISDSGEKDNIMNVISDICLMHNKLPQGTIVSPDISNIVFMRIDQRITKYCQKLNIKYTRYADDLLFSSDKFSFIDKKWFTKKITYILSTEKFQLNYSKKKFGIGEISLNGFVISDIVRISRKRFSDIIKIIKCIKINYALLNNRQYEDFLALLNSIQFTYRDIKINPFYLTLPRFYGHLKRVV